MSKNEKGGALVGIIVFLLIAAIVVLVIMFLRGGFGKGSGKDADTPAIEAAAPAEDEIKYLEIVIDGNDLLHDGKTVTIEDIISLVNDDADISAVKIIDKSASLNAYNDLTAELDSNNIKHIDDNDSASDTESDAA